MSTSEQLNQARERMHELISGNGTWQQRQEQDALIQRLRKRLGDEQVDLALLQSIFS